MTKKKMAYEAPKSETLKVCFGGLVCASKYGTSQAAGQGFSSSNGNIFDYGEDF